jgi:hypothetical protein
VTAHHAIALSLWVRAEVAAGSGETAYLNAMQWLVTFGMSSRAIMFVQQSFQRYQKRINGISQLQRDLDAMHAFYPYSYALLLAYSRYWRHFETVNSYMLDRNSVTSALLSARQRLGLTETSYVPGDTFDFYYCPLCLREYTVTHGQTDTGCVLYNKVSGYDRPIVDYMRSNTLYCSNSGVVAHVHQKVTRLQRVNLLGRILQLNKRIIFICTQPGCATPAVWFHPGCLTTAFGMACILCSHAVRLYIQREHAKETDGYLKPIDWSRVQFYKRALQNDNFPTSPDLRVIAHTQVVALGPECPLLPNMLNDSLEHRDIQLT